jgi:hypothetical protein
VLRRLHHLAAIAALAVFAAAPAHATDFLKAIDDVPLVKGLTEMPEPIVFESDQGRVVRTSAEGNVDGAQVSSFYTASLPALGWRPIASDAGLVFERENERLTIGVREPSSNQPAQVRFELIVKLASTRLPE